MGPHGGAQTKRGKSHVASAQVSSLGLAFRGNVPCVLWLLLFKCQNPDRRWPVMRLSSFELSHRGFRGGPRRALSASRMTEGVYSSANS